MKKLSSNILIATALLIFSVIAIQAQGTLIDQWGLSGEYKTNWPILNDGTTPAGNAAMGGNVIAGWKGLQGGFPELTITTDQALVVRGQIGFVGADAGAAYTSIRYALTYQDNVTLVNPLTDSAAWSHSGNHHGYGFHPRTGAGTMSNGAGGSGTVWTINNGNWASTYSNNGGPISSALQAPRNAEIIEGTYDFAISVQAIDDTTNEIRWYMIEEDNQYWFGGTITAAATSQKFNSIIFGVNEVPFTQFNAIAMKVDYGDPIDVPEAPWQAYYIDQWGLSGEYKTNWPILNDSTTFVGDASIGGAVIAGWKGLQGGFGQDLVLSTEDAIIVKGQIEFVGADAGAAYTPVRYALTYQDNVTLLNALTDSAAWSHSGNHSGYGFHPRTGAGTVSNGAGGSGTVWTINNGNWASTYSNNGGPLASIVQAPRNAEIIAGTYDFAISIQAIDATTNEIRWYMIEEENQYWFGGTITAAATTQKLNSIIFGVNEVPFTQFNVIAMQVDRGEPIEVPEAPWQDYYIDTWSFSKDANGADINGGWSLTPGDLTGNVSIAGTSRAGWSKIEGNFGDVVPKDVRALVLTGKMEFVNGGFSAWNSLQLGIFNKNNAHYNGYLFAPLSGITDLVAWDNNSKLGTVGAIVNGVTIDSREPSYVLSSNLQESGAVAGAGEYDFAFSFGLKGDGANEVRYYIHNDSYAFGGIINDAHDPIVASKFNTISFAFNNRNNSTTELNITDALVQFGDPIDIPSEIVSVEESEGLPTAFELSQNYPNPFNPSTTIEFALPLTSNVKLVVYDILGRNVANLVNGNLNAGYHKINFNASNLASGIYFYKLEAGDFVSVKKLMLLK